MVFLYSNFFAFCIVVFTYYFIVIVAPFVDAAMLDCIGPVDYGCEKWCLIPVFVMNVDVSSHMKYLAY